MIRKYYYFYKIIINQNNHLFKNREHIETNRLEKVVQEIPITFPTSPPRFDDNKELTKELKNESARLLTKSVFLTNEFKEVNI